MQNKKSSDKISAIKHHLRVKPKSLPLDPKPKRVQKNLSLLETDANRLQYLARRDGLSQAALLSVALAFYEKHHNPKT